MAACANTEKPQGSIEHPQVEEQPNESAVLPEKDPITNPIEEPSEQPIKVIPEPKPEPKPKPLPIKTTEGKLILGEQEWVYIPGLDKSFKAKVDTGATISSISAVDVVPFEREGKSWVKFRVEHGEISSNEISLPILRWAKIKQANSEEPQKRAVVSAWIQVGEIKEKANFTLTDRNHLKFPVILGQNFFRDIAIVDVSRKLVQPKKK